MHRIAYDDDPHEETLRTYATWTRELGFGGRNGGSEALVDVSLLRRITR